MTSDNVAPGLYTGMHDAEYAAIPAMRSSVLKAARRSLAHAAYAWDHPEPATPSMRLGSLVDCLTLEPGACGDRYHVAAWEPGAARTRKGQPTPAWAAVLDEAGGRAIVTAEEYATASAMADAVREHPEAGPLVTAPGAAQVAAVWYDKATGIACKAKLDRYAMGLRVELKTTRDASPAGFARQAATLGYHQQVAWYEDGFEAAGGVRDGAPVVIIAVENEARISRGGVPGHAVAVYTLGEADVEVGRRLNRHLLAAWAVALRTGEYPAYPAGVSVCHLPQWALREDAGPDTRGWDWLDVDDHPFS